MTKNPFRVTCKSNGLYSRIMWRVYDIRTGLAALDDGHNHRLWGNLEDAEAYAAECWAKESGS